MASLRSKKPELLNKCRKSLEVAFNETKKLLLGQPNHANPANTEAVIKNLEATTSKLRQSIENLGATEANEVSSPEDSLPDSYDEILVYFYKQGLYSRDIATALRAEGEKSSDIVLLQQSKEVALKLGYKDTAAKALVILAQLMVTSEYLDEAISLYNEVSEYVNESAPGYLAILQNMGAIHMKLGNYKKASKLFKKALSQNAEHPDSLYKNLATNKKLMGKYKKSLKIWTRFADNGDHEVVENIGDCYLGLQKYEKGLNFYKQCLELTESIELQSKVSNKMLHAYFQLGVSVETYPHILTLLKDRGPTEAYYLWRVLQFLVSTKQFQDVTELLKIKIKCDNQELMGAIYALAGYSYSKLGNSKKTIEYYEKSYSYLPETAALPLLVELVRLLFKKKDTKNLKKCVLSLCELSVSSPLQKIWAYTQLLELLLSKNKFDQCQKYLEPALLVYSELGELPETRKLAFLLQKALEIPDFASPCEQLFEKLLNTDDVSAQKLGELAFRLSFTSLAYSYFRRVSNSSDGVERAVAILWLGRCAPPEKALKYYKKSASLFKKLKVESLALSLSLGLVSLDLHHYRKSVKYFKKCLALSPTLPEEAMLHYNLSYCYLAQKDYEAALSSVNACIALSGNIRPQLSQALALRGSIYYELSSYSEAIADYTELSELEPSPYTASVLASLKTCS